MIHNVDCGFKEDLNFPSTAGKKTMESYKQASGSFKFPRGF